MAEQDKGKAVAAGALAVVAGSAALDATQEDVLAELNSPQSIAVELDQDPTQSTALTLLEQDRSPAQQIAVATDLAVALRSPELLEKVTDAMQRVATDIQPKYGRLAELSSEFSKLLPDSDENIVISPADANRLKQLNAESERISRELGILDDKLKSDLEKMIREELELPESSDILLAIRYPFERNESTQKLPFRTSVYIEDSTSLENDAAAEYIFQRKGTEVAMIKSQSQEINLDEISKNALVPNAVLRGLEEIRSQRGFRQVMMWEPWNDSGGADFGTDTYNLAPITDRIKSATGIKLEEAFRVDISGAEFGEPEIEIRFGTDLYNKSGVAMSASGSRAISLSFEIAQNPESPIQVGNPVLEYKK